MDEFPLGLQARDDRLVGVLAELTFVLGNLSGELGFFIERIDQRDARGLAHAVVVFAVRRSQVHDAGAIAGGDERVGQHSEGIRLSGKVREQWFVFQAGEHGAHWLGDDAVLFRLLINRGESILGHQIDLALFQVFNPAIGDLRADTQRQIFRQGPWGRGPRQDEGFAAADGGKNLWRFFAAAREDRAVGITHPKPHGDRRVLHILVIVAGLEVRQRRRQLPRVRHDAVGLVDPRAALCVFLIPELLEDPPHRFHELRVHGFVVIVEVDPAAHAADGLAPLSDVGLHQRAARLVEMRNAFVADLSRA